MQTMADVHFSQPTRLFIFARHAESAANTAHVVNSDPSRPTTLTTRGREQAWTLGEQLANLDIDLGVVTRFLRTRQTIEIALHGRPVPIVVEAGFDEIQSGDLDGAPIEAYWSWKDHHPASAPFPHGESVEDAYRRYASAIRGLLERPEKVTLVVMHGLGLWSVAMGVARTSSRHAAVGAFGNAVPFLFDEGALRRAAAGLDALAPPVRDRRQLT
jgi:broad specificity phosphatase PhoE